MNSDAYELIALAMRYFFAGMMVLIVLRAGRGALIDSRRAAKLRRLSPMTGISGELVVIEGDGKIRRGTRYQVIREGIIGSSRKADLSIRHPAVRRRHAYFQLTQKGLRIRGHAGAKLYVAKHTPVREILLGDGGTFAIGPIRLLLVLGDGRSNEDALFEAHSPAIHSSVPEEKQEEENPYRRPAEDGEESYFRRPVEDGEEAYYQRPVENAEEMRYRRSAENVDEVRYRRPVENAEEMRYRRPVENAEEMRYRRPVENAEEMRYRRPVENTENVRRCRPVENAEVRYRRPVQDVQDVEDDFDPDDIFSVSSDRERRRR